METKILYLLRYREIPKQRAKQLLNKPCVQENFLNVTSEHMIKGQEMNLLF